MGKEEKIIWEKGGSEMVLIPSGSFEMGDHFDGGDDDELPIHEVELDAFYMDAYQVTVGQFKQFIEDSGYDYDDWDSVAEYSPGDGFPMVYVSWNDATAYAKMDLRLDDGSGKASWQFPKECLELEINDYQSQTVSALYFHSCGGGLSCFIAYRITGVYLFVIPRGDNKKTGTKTVTPQEQPKAMGKP